MSPILRAVGLVMFFVMCRTHIIIGRIHSRWHYLELRNETRNQLKGLINVNMAAPILTGFLATVTTVLLVLSDKFGAKTLGGFGFSILEIFGIDFKGKLSKVLFERVGSLDRLLTKRMKSPRRILMFSIARAYAVVTDEAYGACSCAPRVDFFEFLKTQVRNDVSSCSERQNGEKQRSKNKICGKILKTKNGFFYGKTDSYMF